MLKIENHGKNYPPIHPNDRCTTVAEFDDEVKEDLQRRARDENGNSVLVPQDMSYRGVESQIYRYDRNRKKSNSRIFKL